MGAILCGRKCSFTAGGSAYDSHNVELSMQGEPVDVTAFGSGPYGDFVVCRINGTCTANFYDNILNIITPGDELSLVLTLGYDVPVVITVASVLQSVVTGIDAKGIALFSATFRLTGALS